MVPDLTARQQPQGHTAYKHDSDQVQTDDSVPVENATITDYQKQKTADIGLGVRIHFIAGHFI